MRRRDCLTLLAGVTMAWPLGRWISDRAFAMERRALGRGKVQTWTLSFEANKVTVNFENTDGSKAELKGEASE